jgi:4-hydroxybenzoate polyprenyltransferase
VNKPIPLCVDMDGTLLKTDTLLELLFGVLRMQPWVLLLLPLWCLRGKVFLKRELSARCSLNVALLPANTDFLAFLHAEKANGRALYLATGAYRDVAQQVADHYGFFSGVLATSDKNLTGCAKAEAMVAQFGEKGFDYAGNSAVDRPCWEQARQCYLVNANPAATKKMSALFVFEKTFDLRSYMTIALLLRALRIHQWAKNALVFVPLFASHHMFAWSYLQNTLLGFVAFGCCASLSYLINDISDLEADRQHRSKYTRPLASGELSVQAGFVLALLLACTAVLLSAMLPLGFVYSIAAYFIVTSFYTLRLKHIPILDVAVLAGLYTSRVVAGGFSAQAETSFWLLAFSCFIFFSLAIVKRLSELQGIEISAKEEPAQCRGYWTSDIPVLTGLGTASAMMAVLVLALYINSPDVVELYSSPRFLWALCPVMALWLGRVWLITGRNEMHDDPVVFALRDPMSWLLFALAGIFMVVGAMA